MIQNIEEAQNSNYNIMYNLWYNLNDHYKSNTTDATAEAGIAYPFKVRTGCL
jgi:hypothetical protein